MVTMKHEWMPFETAPTDGTEVLVYRKDAGVFTALFVVPACYGEWDDMEPLWFSGGVCEDLTEDLPSHWMPFPDPPEESHD